MWGTDVTRFYTDADGWAWFFGAIDHHLDEVVGWHVAKLGDRWAAPGADPAGRAALGKDVARGVGLRCDWGPQSISDALINEVKWLGITISSSYVGEPECNGVMEFIALYNAEWLIERLGYRPRRGPRPGEGGVSVRSLECPGNRVRHWFTLSNERKRIRR